MKKVNAYILGYKSNEIQTKIQAILEKIKYKSSNDNSGNFNFNDYFIWFNESLETTTKKIKDIIKESKINDRFREIIIYSFENFENHKDEIEKLFQSYDSNRYFQPFFISIANNQEELTKIKDGIRKKIDVFFEENEEEIYEYNFSYLQIDLEETNKPINNISQKIEREVMKKFIRIYSYYNELGDDFFEILKKQNEILKNHEENKRRINILCLGKSQRGKTSFINLLLKEKRSKEGGLGIECTSKIVKYIVDDIPLNIYDTIGISSDKNGEIVNQLLLKIEELQKQLKNEMLHLILYFLDYNDPYTFDPKELNIFKKLCNGNIKAHYIFICTKFGAVNNGKARSKDKINKKITNHMEKVRNSLKELCSNEFVKIIMPNKEKENKNKKETITKKMSIIDYLYCCQESVDIYETNTEIIDEDTKLSKIINIEKSIAYVNTIKFINNGIITEKYGIKNICSKMTNILKIIYKENNEKYKQLLKKNDIDYINDIELNEINPILPNEINLVEEERPLLDRMNINEKKVENILEELEKKAKKNSEKYGVGSALAGVIPIPGIDLLIQYILKKSVIKEIADIFGDYLTEIKINNNSNQNNEFENNIEELINQTNRKIKDVKSNIGKIVLNIVQILNYTLQAFKGLGKISFDIIIKGGLKIFGGALIVGGIIIGFSIGGIVMVSDIEVIIHLFKERLKYNLLVLNSIDQVIDYLNNIE